MADSSKSISPGDVSPKSSSAQPELLDLNRIDAELAQILPNIPSEILDINRDNVVAFREAWTARSKEPVTTPVSIDERIIPTKDVNQADVRVLIYRKPSNQVQAGLIWIHGGGYIVGSAEDNRALAIAEQLDCTVVSVDYRLAPENPFPAGLEDCQQALLWTIEHAGELGIDARRVAIGGASAGGGLATALSLLNRDQNGPEVVMQLLVYPMIDNLHDTPSGRITNHPVWNRRTSLNAWEMYLNGVPGEKASPYASAARATDLAGLPPACICVGTEDLFRDECVSYAQQLITAGVPCELSLYPGLIHGAEAFLPSARVNQRLTKGYLRALRDAFEA